MREAPGIFFRDVLRLTPYVSRLGVGFSLLPFSLSLEKFLRRFPDQEMTNDWILFGESSQ